MSSIKMKRINAEMVRTLSSILQQKSKNELLHTITITAASVSNDLSYCKVYFTSLSELKKEELKKELVSSHDFIRKEVAMMMNLRKTPKFEFVYDESIEYGMKIEKKLKEIHEKEVKKDE